MIFLLRTLSRSYFTRQPGKTLLAVLGVAVGVATFVSIRTAQGTLVNGLETTLDLVAGRSELQITAAGGVPEDLRERLHDLEIVQGDGPVIEQIVEPDPASLGGLLIVGVDLVGDRAIRDYDFSGDDADVDDPLVFLAQPDSIALSREFAARAGLAKGDRLRVRVGAREVTYTVRALLEPSGFARAFGGQVAITDVYAAQEQFGRGRRFDRLDVRLGEGVSADAAAGRIRAAIGSGYRVETPEGRSTQFARITRAFVAAFEVSSVLALGVGMSMIFNVFTVAAHRRRRDIGILRSIGATPLQVQALFLAEALLLGAVGAAAGIVAGRLLTGQFLSVMARGVATAYGLVDAAPPALDRLVVGEALALALAGALAGAWIPSRDAARVAPTEALAAGRFAARPGAGGRWQTVAAMSLLAAAYLIGRSHVLSGRALLLTVTIAAALGTTLIAGAAARLVVRVVAPVLQRMAPVVGRIARDALIGYPRRTAGTATVLIIGLTLVLGLGGYLDATRAAFDRWVRNVMTADLYVRASATLAPSAVRFPSELGDLLRVVPGVAAVEGYRQERIPFRDDHIALVALDGRGFDRRVRHEFVAGDEAAFRRGLGDGTACVVSDNFSRRFNLTVGDTVALDSPTGPVSLPIAAVVTNFISDRGTVMIDRTVFGRRWLTDRVDMFHVTLAPGADHRAARQAVRTRLASAAPALVSTRAEIVEEMDRAFAGFYALTRAAVLIALVVGLMSVATSLFISVVERRRDIGVLKALGTSNRQIAASVAVEALVLCGIALLAAMPLGSRLAWFLRVRVAENAGAFRFPTTYPPPVFDTVLVVLPLVALVAALIPARHAARLRVTDAVSNE